MGPRRLGPPVRAGPPVRLGPVPVPGLLVRSIGRNAGFLVASLAWATCLAIARLRAMLAWISLRRSSGDSSAWGAPGTATGTIGAVLIEWSAFSWVCLARLASLEPRPAILATGTTTGSSFFSAALAVGLAGAGEVVLGADSIRVRTGPDLPGAAGWDPTAAGATGAAEAGVGAVAAGAGAREGEDSMGLLTSVVRATGASATGAGEELAAWLARLAARLASLRTAATSARAWASL